jgi:hypothetical protein
MAPRMAITIPKTNIPAKAEAVSLPIPGFSRRLG